MADPANQRKRKRYQRQWAANRYRERRIGLVKILGGKCDRCGATDELEIHHDSGSTPLRITQLIVGYSVERICAMLRDAGATLLCDECHNPVTHETWVENRRREREAGEDDVPEDEPEPLRVISAPPVEALPF